MEVKIYSINNCKYCDTLKTVLLESFIPFIEVKVRRLSEGEGEGMSFAEYLELEPDTVSYTHLTLPTICSV